jgi:hypothetical protein
MVLPAVAAIRRDRKIALQFVSRRTRHQRPLLLARIEGGQS